MSALPPAPGRDVEEAQTICEAAGLGPVGGGHLAAEDLFPGGPGPLCRACLCLALCLASVDSFWKCHYGHYVCSNGKAHLPRQRAVWSVVALALESWRRCLIVLHGGFLTCQPRMIPASWTRCENHRRRCCKALSSPLGTRPSDFQELRGGRLPEAGVGHLGAKRGEGQETRVLLVRPPPICCVTLSQRGLSFCGHSKGKAILQALHVAPKLGRWCSGGQGTRGSLPCRGASGDTCAGAPACGSSRALEIQIPSRDVTASLYRFTLQDPLTHCRQGSKGQ